MRFFFIPFLFFAVQELQANPVVQHYNIQGTVAAPEKNKIAYLYIYKAGKQPSQLLSTSIVNGRFAFTGSAQTDAGDLARARLFFHTKPGLTQKEYLALYQQGLKFKYRELILEKQVTVKVETTLDFATVKGDEYNEQMNELQRIRQMQIDDFDSLATWRNKQETVLKGDKEGLLKLKADYFKGLRANEDKKDRAYLNFIKSYPASSLAHMYLKVLVMVNRDLKGTYQAELEECIASMPADVKERSAIQPLIAEINKKPVYVNKLLAGTVIPDHTFSAEGADPVSVKDFRGKYLLLDFWTSWCSPCRAEHYNMKQLYTKYKDRNFAILQVSLDDNSAKWKKALAEDNLPWAQVRCLKGWDKEIEARYDIKGVPTTYLIDPEGKIIAHNLRGEALTKKLAELLP